MSARIGTGIDTGIGSSKPISRREFLQTLGITGAGLGSGLLVGCSTDTPNSYLVSNSASARAADQSKHALTEQGFAFNAWIQITPTNDIIFILDKVEMGQGTMTSHAMMVAEELNVDPADIDVRFAPPGSVYINDNFAIHPLFGDWAMGLQMTGSSSSVSSSWQPLRQAAATTRVMLEAAAAQQWGVPVERCKASNKQVSLQGSEQRLSYGQLAEQARQLDSLPPPPLKQPAQFSTIGRNIQRLDIPAKVDGSARFGIDSGPADSLQAVIIRSPYVTATGMLKDADAVKARLSALPGLRQVVLLPARDASVSCEKDADPASSTSATSSENASACAGIALIADTFWQAHSIAEAQRAGIEWLPPSPLPPGSSDVMGFLEQALQPYREDFDSNTEALQSEHGGSHSETLVYQIPLAPHATLEPMNCTVLIDSDQHSAEIWVPTQSPKGAQGTAMRITGFEQDAVKVHTTLIGGGFGRRVYSDFVREAVQIAVALAPSACSSTQQSGDEAWRKRAIKLIWSREDDFQHDLFRPPSYHRVSGGVAPQAAPAAPTVYWNHAVASPSVLSASIDDFTTDIGANLSTAEIFRGTRVADKLSGAVSYLASRSHPEQDATEGLRNPPYMPASLALPGWGANGIEANYNSAQHKLCYVFADPGIPIGLWRSVGHSGNAFVSETFIDHLACRVAADPYLFRRQLIAANAPAEDRDRLLGVLDQVATLADWANCDRSQGWGIAVHKSFGSYCAQVAKVSVKNGRIKVNEVYCAVDCGRMVNPAIVESQVEGSIIYALSATLKNEITLRDGRIEQRNFPQWDPLRIDECPEIHMHLVDSSAAPSGIGEPCVPPTAPAVANAVFALTQQRLTRLPLRLDAAQSRPCPAAS